MGSGPRSTEHFFVGCFVGFGWALSQSVVSGEDKTFNRQFPLMFSECKQSKKKKTTSEFGIEPAAVSPQTSHSLDPDDWFSDKHCCILQCSIRCKTSRLDSELQTLDLAASRWWRVLDEPFWCQPGHSLTETPNQCLECVAFKDRSDWTSDLFLPLTSFCWGFKLALRQMCKESEREDLGRNLSWLLIHFYAHVFSNYCQNGKIPNEGYKAIISSLLPSCRVE